ncbi:TPA: Veg family protein [Streptococcus suis]|uniref:Veg family protein n=1 Tax=Streptococcus suis TaxID=1307 RepID=UPI0021195638|nr:Veg family protein [Streptococcus suis]MCQ8785252.1 Veg family protein [Streptococcus suis]WQE85577.1 Veg family protein [Streptococcus suis]HEM4567396.1 Veg family protein [Streptococcus suis]
MSDAFTDVAKMKQIKQDIKDHEGQIVELTLENGRKREKNKQGRIAEVYQSLFIVEFEDPNNTFVESYTYSDILTEKILIHYLD